MFNKNKSTVVQEVVSGAQFIVDMVLVRNKQANNFTYTKKNPKDTACALDSNDLRKICWIVP